MKKKSSVVWVVLLFCLLGVLLVERRIVRSSPPYAPGIHNLVVQAQTGRSGGDGPHIGNCPIFPKDNIWNTPVDSLPKDEKSDAYLQSIGLDKKIHPDFGSDLHSGIPFTEIPKGTKRVHVNFAYRDDSDLGNYPIPNDAPVEGGSDSDGDRHIILIDPQRCLLNELYAARMTGPGEWEAGSGIKMDLTSNALRAEGKTSADAAGLPILPGLVRYEEVASGEIRHALRFTVPHTQNAYIWPARHKASKDTNPNLPPMGIRIRLRADTDLSRFSKTNQVILTALKHYGMILADNGGPMFLTGAADKRWDDSDLHKLGSLTAADFEVVNEADWQMLPDSARVDPVELR